jgi:hypothetical protein
VKVADALVVVRGGVVKKVVLGAVASTVHVKVAGVASTFPAASMALTEKVWLPSARPV